MNEHNLLFLYVLKRHLQRTYVTPFDLTPIAVTTRLEKFAATGERTTMNWQEFIARHERR